MKDLSTVCRVCCSENQVLLDLFGSNAQNVCYAEDVNRCLSVEVSEGDSLPSKICIKCVGRLTECRPFVDNILKVNDKKESHRQSNAAEACYICLSSENYLFIVPEDSISKLNGCFDIVIKPTSKICHKCQFYLETIHELKSKACSTLKEFYTKSLISKENTSVGTIESICDIVNDLKNKYIMHNKEIKVLQVKMVDVGLIIGSDFFSKGTVSVTEFWEKLEPTGKKNVKVQKSLKMKPDTSCVNDKIPDCKESQNLKKCQSVPALKKSTNVIGVNHSEDISSSTEASSKIMERKRSRESKECEEDNPHKRLKVGNMQQDARAKSLEKSDGHKQRKSSNTSYDQNRGRSKGKSSPKNRIHESLISPDTSKQKSKFMKDSMQTEPSSTVPDSCEDSQNSEESRDRLEQECNESAKESNSLNKKKNRRDIDSSHSSISNKNRNKVDAVIKRKRKLSEDDKTTSFKTKIRRKCWEPSSDDDSGLDDSTADVNEDAPVVEQPSFLKKLDELLKFTPKTTFKPFICSICHEGYVSTVKGKLHKLVVHDPHSNMILRIKRCEDDTEMKKIIEISLLRAEERSKCVSNEDVNEGCKQAKVAQDTTIENEKKSGEMVSGGHDSDDDMFELKGINNKDAADAFDKLFSSTKETGDNEGKETENESIHDVRMKVNKKAEDGEEGDNYKEDDTVVGAKLDATVEGQEEKTIDEKKDDGKEDVTVDRKEDKAIDQGKEDVTVEGKEDKAIDKGKEDVTVESKEDRTIDEETDDGKEDVTVESKEAKAIDEGKDVGKKDVSIESKEDKAIDEKEDVTVEGKEDKAIDEGKDNGKEDVTAEVKEDDAIDEGKDDGKEEATVEEKDNITAEGKTNQILDKERSNGKEILREYENTGNQETEEDSSTIKEADKRKEGSLTDTLTHDCSSYKANQSSEANHDKKIEEDNLKNIEMSSTEDNDTVKVTSIQSMDDGEKELLNETCGMVSEGEGKIIEENSTEDNTETREEPGRKDVEKKDQDTEAQVPQEGGKSNSLNKKQMEDASGKDEEERTNNVKESSSIPNDDALKKNKECLESVEKCKGETIPIEVDLIPEKSDCPGTPENGEVLNINKGSEADVKSNGSVDKDVRTHDKSSTRSASENGDYITKSSFGNFSC